jgi:outer membrane phospholipase A
MSALEQGPHRWCLRVVRRPLWIAVVLLGAMAARPAPARAWFCSRYDDSAEVQAHREALFSQFKDNYFETGRPWSHGLPATDPRRMVRFQVSLKFNLIPTRSPCTLFFAYSQKSLWALWTFPTSPHFDDSNYNPAFFLAWRNHDSTVLLPSQARGLRLQNVYAGYEHESNGLGNGKNIGWDRLSAFARVGYFFASGFHLIVQPKAWIPFVPSDAPPHFIDYRGYGEITVELGRDHVPGPTDAYVYRDFVFSVLARPATSVDRGYVEASWRIHPFKPAWVSWSFFLQYAAGFGETLSHYNEKLPPAVIRLGIALDDRLSILSPAPAAAPAAP